METLTQLQSVASPEALALAQKMRETFEQKLEALAAPETSISEMLEQKLFFNWVNRCFSWPIIESSPALTTLYQASGETYSFKITQLVIANLNRLEDPESVAYYIQNYDDTKHRSASANAGGMVGSLLGKLFNKNAIRTLCRERFGYLFPAERNEASCRAIYAEATTIFSLRLLKELLNDR